MEAGAVCLFFCLAIILIFLPTHHEGFTCTSKEFRDRYHLHGITRDKENELLMKDGTQLYYGKSFNSPEADRNCQDKARTNHILREAGLPVAPIHVWDHGRSVGWNTNMVESRMTYPVVVKPRQDHKGRGVRPGIQTRNMLAKAVRNLGDRKILVEREVVGDEYRVTVVKGQVVAISKRSFPRVVGDGVSTVDTLVAASKRAAKHPIHTVDYDLLKAEGHPSHSIPKLGEIVILSKVANYSNGGDLEYVPVSKVHPSNIDMFGRAARCIKADITGMDYMVSSDLSIPYFRAGTAAIIDVNQRPMWGAAYDPAPASVKPRMVDHALTLLFH